LRFALDEVSVFENDRMKQLSLIDSEQTRQQNYAREVDSASANRNNDKKTRRNLTAFEIFVLLSDDRQAVQCDALDRASTLAERLVASNLLEPTFWRWVGAESKFSSSSEWPKSHESNILVLSDHQRAACRLDALWSGIAQDKPFDSTLTQMLHDARRDVDLDMAQFQALVDQGLYSIGVTEVAEPTSKPASLPLAEVLDSQPRTTRTHGMHRLLRRYKPSLPKGCLHRVNRVCISWVPCATRAPFTVRGHLSATDGTSGQEQYTHLHKLGARSSTSSYNHVNLT
jgi:hypothetical protein